MSGVPQQGAADHSRAGSQQALVIINPLAGHGRQANQVAAHIELAQRVLRDHGIEALVRPTGGPGDAMAFAREAIAGGCRLVVAWGGDGTINEAARAVAHTGATLAIVPAGSGNGLAADLRIPFDPRAALELAATGPTLAIDAGQVNDCQFFNIAGVGIDAVIAARFAERGMRQRGLFGYMQLGTQELLRYRCQRYRFTIEDEIIEHEALIVAMANGRQYGNRLFIAPGARPDDGQLELVIVERLSLLSIAWRLPSVFRGALRPGNGVWMRAASSLRIHAPGPIPFHVDGEPRIADGELVVATHPGALRVRVPRVV